MCALLFRMVRPESPPPLMIGTLRSSCHGSAMARPLTVMRVSRGENWAECRVPLSSLSGVRYGGTAPPPGYGSESWLTFSEPWMSALETGRLLPKPDQIAAMEEALHIPSGVLLEVCKQLDIEGTPQWFREWRDVETGADVLRWVELCNIPGLLQTEDYASAILGGDQAAVAARMERRQILTRDAPPPPTLHCVLDEAVLYRGFGGPKTMYDQLLHLADSVGPLSRSKLYART